MCRMPRTTRSSLSPWNSGQLAHLSFWRCWPSSSRGLTDCPVRFGHCGFCCSQRGASVCSQQLGSSENRRGFCSECWRPKPVLYSRRNRSVSRCPINMYQERRWMVPRYLLRFDDICPTMNWPIWDRVEQTLIDQDIQPIVAVIPNNQDPALNVHPL